MSCFPECIKDHEIEKVIINGLSSPWVKMRADTLEEISNSMLKPFWTENIRAHLEKMIFNDPDEDIKNLVKDIIRIKLRPLRK